MTKHCTEGIILQSLNFQDFDQILTVFTPSEGLIKLIVKGANKKFTPSTPLTFSEFIYTKGKSDIYKCYEMNPIHLNLQLRTSFASLEAVYAMLKALLQTLPLLHPVPHLFSLFIWTLAKMPLVKDPHTLSLSFLMKLLRHEGLFPISTACQECNVEGKTVLFAGKGGVFCPQHTPYGGVVFHEEELESIKQLAFLSNFQNIKEWIIEDPLRKKIHLLCEHLWI